MPELDDLIARAISRGAQTNTCWAARLEDEAKQFVEALTKIEKESPGKVNRRQVSFIMGEKFGVKISRETARNHFSGDCRCGR